MKFDLRGFKKIRSDKSSTTLRHPAGHEITVAHAPLAPKMVKQLSDLPMHLAEGGEAIVKDKGPAIDKQGAADVVKGATESKPASMSYMQNLKDGLGLADGGKIPGGSGTPYTDPKGAKEVEKGASESGFQPKQWIENIKEGLGIKSDKEDSKMYKGGGVKDPTQEPLTEGDQTSDQPQQAPVTINIGTNPNALQMPPAALAQPSANASPQSSGASASWDAPPPSSQAAMPAQQQQEPKAPMPAQQPQQAPPAQDMFGYEAFGKTYAQGINEQKAGILGQAQAESQLGHAQAAQLQQNIQSQQQTLRSYQDHFNDLEMERKNVAQDYTDGHIDPNRFLNSMDTGQKIKTGIGLILGGMGAGILHQQNPVLQYLNNQIDRDIASQKAELDKKNSLLTANLRQFGNLRDATDMTRVMQMDLVSNELKKAAAQSADPLAKAWALQAAGHIDTQPTPILSQVAMRRTLISGMQSGKIDPSLIVNMVVPENQRADANKELIEAQNTVSARDNLLNAFDKLSEVNTLSNTMTSPIQTSKQVSAIRNPLLAAMSKGTAGRFTEADAKMLEPLFPAKGDNEQTLAIKRSQLEKIASEKMHFPILNTYGIDVNKMGRFGAQGQSRIQESAPIKQ